MREIIRRRYIFKGRVQGVGFRYRAQMAADRLRLTGWVRNCYDGSVEMEIQGTIDEIHEAIEMINRGTYIYIESIEYINIDPEEERSFRVRHY